MSSNTQHNNLNNPGSSLTDANRNTIKKASSLQKQMSTSTSNLVASSTAASLGEQRLEAQRVNNTASCWDKYGQSEPVTVSNNNIWHVAQLWYFVKFGNLF